MDPALRRRIAGWALRLAAAAILAALPFYLLVRGALVASARWGWNAWLAVAFGMLLSALAASGIAWWAQRRLALGISFRALATRAALPLVAVFCAFSVVHLSRSNAKDAEVRAAWTALHPALRLAVGTLRLLDGRIVLTDIERGEADYAAMRLPRPEHSFHYRQEDGTVHAIDLRTEGRGAVRNELVRAYFELLGFETIRHVGTADHLHVRLPGLRA
jgi:hypothetical protein